MSSLFKKKKVACVCNCVDIVLLNIDDMYPLMYLRGSSIQEQSHIEIEG